MALSESACFWVAAAEGFFGALLQVFHMMEGPEALMTPKLIMKALISRVLRAVKHVC